MAVSTRLTYTYRDSKGKTATTEIKLPSGTSLIDISVFAAGLAQLIDPLLRGALVGITASISIGLPSGIRTEPTIEADVEEKGYFQFVTPESQTKLALPTLNEDYTAASGDIDLTDPDVASFVNAMVDGFTTTGGGGSGVIQPTDGRDEDITALAVAYELFRNSGTRR